MERVALSGRLSVTELWGPASGLLWEMAMAAASERAWAVAWGRQSELELAGAWATG